MINVTIDFIYCFKTSLKVVEMMISSVQKIILELRRGSIEAIQLLYNFGKTFGNVHPEITPQSMGFSPLYFLYEFEYFY